VRRRPEVQVAVERPSRSPRPFILAFMTRTDDQTGYAHRLREATDPSTSPWRLAALADDPDPDVRMAVAANPSASSLTILRLGRDVDPRVRAILAVRNRIGA
jgi:hypothetical protein